MSFKEGLFDRVVRVGWGNDASITNFAETENSIEVLGVGFGARAATVFLRFYLVTDPLSNNADALTYTTLIYRPPQADWSATKIKVPLNLLTESSLSDYQGEKVRLADKLFVDAVSVLVAIVKDGGGLKLPSPVYTHKFPNPPKLTTLPPESGVYALFDKGEQNEQYPSLAPFITQNQFQTIPDGEELFGRISTAEYYYLLAFSKTLTEVQYLGETNNQTSHETLPVEETLVKCLGDSYTHTKITHTLAWKLIYEIHLRAGYSFSHEVLVSKTYLETHGYDPLYLAYASQPAGWNEYHRNIDGPGSDIHLGYLNTRATNDYYDHDEPSLCAHIRRSS